MLKDSRVTAADVAKELGISRSTVSRAFSPDAYVKPATRAKILSTAKSLGYEPNAVAQALISKRSKIVGIIMGDLHNPFHAQIHSALTEGLQSAGLIPITAQIGPENAIDQALTMFRQYQAGAVLLTSLVVSQDMIAECDRAGIPTVILNRIDEEGVTASVCADLEFGGSLAAKHLVKTGRKRIAIIQGLAGSWTSKARLAGYLRGLEESGLQAFKQIPGDYTYQCGIDAACELLSAGRKPDAVLCGNDLTAIGFLDGARLNFGAVIPEDIAVVGFDDIPMASWQSYNLTTVRLPVKQMIDRTIDLLDRFVTGRQQLMEKVLVPCRLIERKTA